jgi:hypothetical protein
VTKATIVEGHMTVQDIKDKYFHSNKEYLDVVYQTRLLASRTV